MACKNFVITIPKGSDYTVNVIIEDTDLTGFSGIMEFRRTKDNATVDFTASTVNGRMVITPDSPVVGDSNVAITVPNAESTLLSDSYITDLKLTSGGSVVTYFLENTAVNITEVSTE